MSYTQHRLSFVGQSAGLDMGFNQIDMDALKEGCVPDSSSILSALVTIPFAGNLLKIK